MGNKAARIVKDNSYADVSPQELVQSNLNRFFGWKCSAGTEGIYIDHDGDVYPGTCQVGEQKYHLGNIHNANNITLLQDYITCNRHNCPCFGEIYLTKYRKAVPYWDKIRKGNVEINDFDAVTASMPATRQSVKVMWAFGRKCNFDCSYCDDISHSKDAPLVSQEAIDKLLAYTDNLRQGKTIEWSITGGEPTLNPALLPLVKYLNEKGDSVNISTNASQSGEYLQKLGKYSNILISVHFEFLKPKKLKKVVEKLAANDKFFSVNFMVMPKQVSLVEQYITELRKLEIPNSCPWYVHLDLLRVKNTHEYHLYSAVEIEQIQKLQKELNNGR